MPGNQVRIGVGVTGAKGAASEMDRLKDKFSNLQKQGAKGFAIGAGVALTNAAFLATGRVIGEITNTIGEATEAFIEDERSQVQLRAALNANVDAWDGNTKAIEDTLSARMKLGFSDDEQRESLKGLVGAYGDVEKALETQRLAMDLARFSGTDLASASDVLIKVHAGNYRALRTLGINTKDVTNETEALAAIQKVAAGQAEAYTQTLEGRLLVAQVKSAEATERLGQATAELSADFEEAKSGAFENLATGIDTFADALHASEQPFERQIELSRIAIQVNPLLTDEMKKQAQAQLDSAVAAYRNNRALDGTTVAVDDLADAAREAKTPTSTLKSELGRLRTAANNADDAIDDLSDTISEELFGEAITTGHIARLNKTYDELLKQRDGAKKGSREYKILTGEIAENRQELFELQLQMKEKEGPRAVIDFLRTQKRLYGDANGALQRLIDKYRTLSRIQGSLVPLSLFGGKMSNFKTFAEGGRPKPGEPAIVGEEGPELFVPDSAGTVIPNGGSTGGVAAGGGDTIINLYGVSVLTPGAADELARKLEPVITRAQQRRGQVTAARAF